MKYLIYELFSGVGFCNQLFSLETAIYLANITDRKLILLVRNPLCHCGRASWDYGKFLDFFSDDYKIFLPHGLEVYYGAIPKDISQVIDNNELCQTIPFTNRLSHIVIVDKDLSDKTSDIAEFCNNRSPCIVDFSSLNCKDYLYTNKSNASRCFYNFYTNKENYSLMSKICESLTNLNSSFNSINYKIDADFICIHLRLGDVKYSKKEIDGRSIRFYNNLKSMLDVYGKNKTIVVMSDRQDGELLDKLSHDFNIINSLDILSKIEKKNFFDNYKRHEVVDFLIQLKLCSNNKLFIGYECSTVSNYLHYLNYIKYNDYGIFYVNKTIFTNKDDYSWCLNNECGAKIGFALFFPENIIRSSIKLITLTNNGYKNLTDNLLSSMSKIGIEKLLKIYCIGDECYNHYKLNYPYNEIEKIYQDDDNLNNWIEYRSCQNTDIEGKKQWANITSYKLYCINKELVSGNDVIFTDGDIVFEKNPYFYLTQHIGDNDLLIQNDNQSADDRQFCTGFFYMKSNTKTISITNFSEISKHIDNFQNDQQYLRRFEKQLDVKYLPLDLFPNGKYWREKIPSNPYIIHFNYDVSEHKIRRMKKYNKWYLDGNINFTPVNVASIPRSIIKSEPIPPTYEKKEIYYPLTKYIETKGIKLRQGYITQVKKHEESILECIKKVFPNTNNIKNVLEIGFLAGHSADLFLKLNETTIVHSFDSGAFQSVDAGKKYIDQLYPARHILIKGDSKQTIPSFIEKNNVKFDIILIDGGYDYDSVLSDFSNCKHLSHSDTLLIANNVLKDQNLIKYWNKEHTNVWNKLHEDKVVEKIENIDIDIGRGSVIGKYNFDNYFNKENSEQKKNNELARKNTVKHIVIHSKRTAGFYSNLLGIIYNAYIHIVDGKVPYILWENPKYMGNKGDNIFNYFFEQPQIEVTHNDKIIIENGIRYNEIIKMAKSNNLSFREQMHKMYNLVCKVKPEFINKFDEYTKKLNLNNLDAFHMRKTDRYIGGKGLIYAGPNQDTIESYIKSNSLYSFYLATDCKNTFTYFNNKYNCCSYATIRSSGTIGIHNSNEINNNNKIMAEEAFIESYLLSRCKTLHRVTSNFTIFSLIVNPKQPFVDLSCMFKNEIIKEHKLNDIYLEDFLLK